VDPFRLADDRAQRASPIGIFFVGQQILALTRNNRQRIVDLVPSASRQFREGPQLQSVQALFLAGTLIGQDLLQLV
jgi:hypothetical protein